MSRLNGGKRDENHPNRSVIRERFQQGRTLTLEEYNALNPEHEPLTDEPPRTYHTGTPADPVDRDANIHHEPSTITPGITGVHGRVYPPGPHT
jgi:hypothetical protein